MDTGHRSAFLSERIGVWVPAARWCFFPGISQQAAEVFSGGVAWRVLTVVQLHMRVGGLEKVADLLRELVNGLGYSPLWTARRVARPGPPPSAGRGLAPVQLGIQLGCLEHRGG